MTTKDAVGGFTTVEEDPSVLRSEVTARIAALGEHEGEETYEVRKMALYAALDALDAVEESRRLAFRLPFAV